MLKPVHEPFNGPISYPIGAALVALSTQALINTGATDLNLPYGAGDSVGFVAGQIVKLSSESSTTVVNLPSSGSDDVFGILASGYTDSLKSGKVDVYPLTFGGIFKVKGCYDLSNTYSVNTKLTFIPSGTNAGKLIPASVYSTETIVARVIEAPSNASADTEMVVEIMYEISPA